jgi:hypothetical protein
MAHALTISDTLDYNDNGAGYYFLPPGESATDSPWYRWYNQDWGWTHDFGFAPDSVSSATLTIEAWDVDDDEVNVVTGDGQTLGNLAGVNYAWSTTIFTVDPSVLLDGSLDVFLDIDSQNDLRTWAVTLKSSTLSMEYDLDQGSGGPAPTPEPTTMLLLGSGLVGLSSLRRKFKK